MTNIILTIITSLISGLCVALPSVYSTKNTLDRNNALQDERIQNLQKDLQGLAAKVEQHNNFGLQLENIKARLTAIEQRKG